MARLAAQGGDDGTNDLLVGGVIRTGELQVWFVAGHVVDTPAVRVDAWPFAYVRPLGPVDRQTEQLGSTVVAARVHQLLALVDAGEVEIGDDDSFPGPQGFADQSPVRGHDRGETTAGYRANGPSGVLHDLGLLVGIQPGRRTHDEARGFQRVLPDVDLRLHGEQIPKDRPGIHRRMDLFAVGHQRIAGQRVVVLPARQLADATDGTIDGTQSRT